jgi:hypothetical protein
VRTASMIRHRLGSVQSSCVSCASTVPRTL